MLPHKQTLVLAQLAASTYLTNSRGMISPMVLVTYCEISGFDANNIITTQFRIMAFKGLPEEVVESHQHITKL